MIYIVFISYQNGLFRVFLNFDRYSMYQIADYVLPYSVLHSLAAIIVIAFVILIKPNSKSYNIISSIFFSLFSLIGIMFDQIGSFCEGVLKNVYVLLLSIAWIIGFYFLIIRIIELISLLVQHVNASSNWSDKLYQKVSGKKLVASCFLSQFLLWLPIAIVKYPAGFESDAYKQIHVFIQGNPLGAGPFLSTTFMGIFPYIGDKILNSYNIGIFFYIIFWMCIYISIFTYSIYILYKLKVNFVWIVFINILYSIVPIFSGFYTSVAKDAMYSAFLFLDVLFIADICFCEHRISILFFLGILISTFAAYNLRANGPHVLIIWIICLIVFAIVDKKCMKLFRIVIAMICAVCMSIIVVSVLSSFYNDTDAYKYVIYDSLFQQTARYLKEYPNDIEDEERNIIDSVLDADRIADIYNPLLVDPVRGTAHGNDDQIKEYLKVWLKCFKRHPDVYFDAFLNNSYGFLDLSAEQGGYMIVGFYLSEESDNNKYFSCPAALFSFREAYRNWMKLWERVPILSLIERVPIYLWGAIWLFVYAVIKRRMVIITLPPVLTSILVCMVSPTWWHNGFRYALPIVCITPFLLISSSSQKMMIN